MTHTLTTVRVATGLRAVNQSIAWIGAKAGTFARRKLQVEFPALEVGGPEAVAGLQRGDWDFAQTGTVPIAEAVLNGGDAVIVLNNTGAQDNVVLLAQPNIQDLGALAGKKIGVLTDAYSGQTGAIVRLTLEHAGATAHYVGLGTYRNIYAALVSGAVQAAALPIEFCFLHANAQPWTRLDMHALRVPSVLATTRKLIASDRPIVLRVLRGFLDAIDLIRTRADLAGPLLQQFLQLNDAHAVGRVLAFYASTLPQSLRPDPGAGMDELRELFAGRHPAAVNLREADLVDASLMEELNLSDAPQTWQPATSP